MTGLKTLTQFCGWTARVRPFQGINDADSDSNVNSSQPTSSSFFTRISWAYCGLFSRDGLLSAAPFFPGPRLSAAHEDDKQYIIYASLYDALNKTITFFAEQSVSSSIAYEIVGAVAKPPGQQFDIRYILTRDANTNFSLFNQFKNFSDTGTLTPIFWLLLIPGILRLLLSLVCLCMSSETKDRTNKAYNDVNSWLDCLKLYGWQAIEILAANVLVNVISLSAGNAKSPVFDDPEMINCMKVLLALMLDFLRNSTEKLITYAKDNEVSCNPCARPYERLA